MVYKSGQIFLPFCHNTRVWQTDGQTDRHADRQTDRILITIPRLHYMQRGKKQYFFKCMDEIHCNRGRSVFMRWKWSISDCDNEFCHVSLLIYCLSFIGMCIFTYIIYFLFVYFIRVIQVVKSICKPIKSLW